MVRLVDIIESYLHKLLMPGDGIRFCKKNDKSCEVAICGSLALGLRNLGLYPVPDPETLI
jgi:hypothetical protein